MKTTRKKITLIWDIEHPHVVPATLSFEEDFYGQESIPNGTWLAPYPNTEEDSLVFGLMESYAQGSSPVAVFVQAQQWEPTKVIISDI